MKRRYANSLEELKLFQNRGEALRQARQTATRFRRDEMIVGQLAATLFKRSEEGLRVLIHRSGKNHEAAIYKLIRSEGFIPVETIRGL